MKKKILLIGRNSFISSNLQIFLKKKFSLKILSFKDLKEYDSKYFNKFSHIINCAIHKNYINYKYNPKNDLDIQIVKKLKSFRNTYVFLSSRKVYKTKNNIKENDDLYPLCHYSKNKLRTENELQKIFKNKVLILRISNLLGLKLSKYKMKNSHTTFIDYFMNNVKLNIIFNNNKNMYKDFLSIKQFSKILEKLIHLNSTGIFNVSLGKKVYLNKLIEWLNYYNKNSFKKVDLPKKFNKDKFYLSNKKLFKEINLKFSLTDLERECKKISKSFFKK